MTGTTTAPPTTGPAAQKGKNVYFVSCGQSAGGCSDPAAGAVAAGKALGWNVTVEDGAFNVGGAYNTAIRQAIAAKPDGIILEAIDCSSVRPALQEAKDANIPVVGFSSFDCDEDGSGDSGMFAYKIIPNAVDKTAADFNQRFGRYQAAYLIGKTASPTNVLWLNETDNIPVMDNINTGFHDAMSTCSACKVTDVNFTENNFAAVGPALTSAILQNPHANALAPGYDTPYSFGAAKALSESGAADRLTVMAGQGTSVGMDMLRNGQAAAAVPWDATYGGWMTMDTLNRFFAGQPQVAEGWGFQLVQDASGAQPGKGWATTIDYQADYTKVWDQ
ncbi:substrate-binding domain-containing protein [Arthrobacter sp. MI7-26]|uniref:sugar ABC transporter substrate-binding protein n=1 Tax=Arthrobacter sp. MI7-26 TaxID=2993653 RepID=UPI0022495F61|nr:substrate-binding domain-containing protein [Arthrobacter sp. MI7-26]MCX2748095.1 substrate-binding domain-containing protein [Arthrobacter sp. MI7-26]